MVKYASGFPVVAMVSHIPVKSRIAGNDVMFQKLLISYFYRCFDIAPYSVLNRAVRPS